MLAGEALSAITTELQRQERTITSPNWSEDLAAKVCDATMLGDLAFEKAYRKASPEEIKAALIRVTACYIRILKELKP